MSLCAASCAPVRGRCGAREEKAHQTSVNGTLDHCGARNGRDTAKTCASASSCRLERTQMAVFSYPGMIVCGRAGRDDTTGGVSGQCQGELKSGNADRWS